jgi:hypothetical protein
MRTVKSSDAKNVCKMVHLSGAIWKKIETDKQAVNME